MRVATLDQILATAQRRAEALWPRRTELERAAANAPPARPFGARLKGEAVGIIAEIKRRSPSAGPIDLSLDAAGHAAAYVRGGAVAVSVLTDGDYFGGSLADLTRVAQAVTVPVLRKDFIVDQLQLLEARAAGASAALLIARALGASRLRDLAGAARSIGLATLIEVHDAAELDAALAAGADTVGVNNRDLATYTVDLAVAERLLPQVPPAVAAVAESGVESRTDVERMAAAGADLVLIGAALARRKDPVAALRELVAVRRHDRAARS